MDKSWHILRVVSGTERSIALRLGVPAYVPQRLHVSYNRKQRRVSRRFLPAIPGLVFVGVDEPRSINTTFVGALGWMRDVSRNYIKISPQDFRDMRQLEVHVWQAEKPQTKEEPEFNPGDAVQFKDRALFEGHRAVIERLRGNRAFFRILTSGLVVEADLDEVKRVA